MSICDGYNCPFADELEIAEGRIKALEKKWSLVFDGYSVLQGLTEEQKLFISPEAVAAVLDSVAKLAALLEDKQ